MVDVVNNSLKRYPFTSTKEKNLVFFNDKNDFPFFGNDTLIAHVLLNLLKNSLFYIAKARKGNIQIYLENNEAYNILHFKDAATGIPVAMLPHLFELFYTKTENSSGIGLFYCKMVMTNLGGDILCESQEGLFTEFKLLFPKIVPKF
jgi:signal transduction histidine kinase